MASITTLPREREADAALSVPDAAERTVEAARRLAQDWLELARLEIATALRSRLVAAGLLGAGIAFVVLGWVAAAAAGALALARFIDFDASVACVALAHVVLGSALLVFARRRLAGAEDTRR